MECMSAGARDADGVHRINAGPLTCAPLLGIEHSAVIDTCGQFSQMQRAHMPMSTGPPHMSTCPFCGFQSGCALRRMTRSSSWSSSAIEPSLLANKLHRVTSTLVGIGGVMRFGFNDGAVNDGDAGAPDDDSSPPAVRRYRFSTMLGSLGCETGRCLWDTRFGRTAPCEAGTASSSPVTSVTHACTRLSSVAALNVLRQMHHTRQRTGRVSGRQRLAQPPRRGHGNTYVGSVARAKSMARL
jgi:hypothetical protein